MGKTKRKWIDLDFLSSTSLRAQDIPYDGSNSIKDKIDANTLWDRTGTVLSPLTSGDTLKLDGMLTLNNDVTLGYPVVVFDGQSDTDWQGAFFDIKRSRGTAVSPTDVQIGDTLFAFESKGYKDGALRKSGIYYSHIDTLGTNIASASHHFDISLDGSTYTQMVEFSPTTNKFNLDAVDLDFEILKLVSGTAYKYDAGTDEHTLDGGVTIVDLANTADTIPITDANGKVADTTVTITNGIASGSLLNMDAYATDPASPEIGDMWILEAGGNTFWKRNDGVDIWQVLWRKDGVVGTSALNIYTANHTLTEAEETAIGKTNAFTFTLPAVATTTVGKRFDIKNDSDNIGNDITLTGNGTEKIDSSEDWIIGTGDSMTVENDGTKWHIL